MNTLHFKYAVEIEKTGSISKAAENLYMGQIADYSLTIGIENRAEVPDG